MAETEPDVDEQVADDPNADTTERLRAVSVAMGTPDAPKMPKVLYEGYFWKKMERSNLPGVGDALKAMSLVAGGKLNWKKRYVRLFAGKLEWYTDDSPKSFLKPLGFAPLGVFDIDRSPPDFRRITTTGKWELKSDDGASPCSHNACASLMFNAHS